MSNSVAIRIYLHFIIVIIIIIIIIIIITLVAYFLVNFYTLCVIWNRNEYSTEE